MKRGLLRPQKEMTFQIQKILASSMRSKSDSFHQTFPDNLLNTGTAQRGCRPLVSLQQSLPCQGCTEIPLTSNPLSHFIHSRTWHWAPIMGQALFRMLGVQWWTWPILRNLSSSRESRYWFFFKSQNKCTVTNCDKCLEGKVHSGKRAHVGVGRGPNFLEVRKGFPEELTFELKYEG